MSASGALEHLKLSGPHRLDFGICSNLKFDNMRSASNWYERQDQCFAEWSEFSGNLNYPVPAANAHQNPAFAYEAGTEETMWSMEHPYGQARWRLLDHCIKWFKEKGM